MSRRAGTSLFDVLHRPQAKNLSAGDKLALLYLAWRQGQNGQSWPSLDTIARDLHVARRSCLRSIARLGQAGCIEKASGRCGRGHSNRYTILIEKQGQADTFSPDAKGDALTPFVRANRDKTGAQIGTECPLKEQEKEPGTGRARTKHPRVRHRKPFIPPMVDEVADYAEQRGDPQFDAERFVSWYAERNWIRKDGAPVLDWKGTVRAWIDTDNKRRIERGEPPHDGFSQYGTHPATEDEIAELEKAGAL